MVIDFVNYWIKVCFIREILVVSFNEVKRLVWLLLVTTKEHLKKSRQKGRTSWEIPPFLHYKLLLLVIQGLLFPLFKKPVLLAFEVCFDAIWNRLHYLLLFCTECQLFQFKSFAVSSILFVCLLLKRVLAWTIEAVGAYLTFWKTNGLD